MHKILQSSIVAHAHLLHPVRTCDLTIDKGGERDWKRTVYMYVHLQS